MKHGGLQTAVHDIQVLFDSGTIAGMSDEELLERFVARPEAAIFEALTRRHGPMVWGVCRRVLQDHHDAEDAFQATFLVLARKAASVMPREKLANWLYGVASQTSRKARASRARRRGQEVVTSNLPEPEPTRQTPLDDWLADLDRELARLPAKYRIPIVLCELEGKTHREAADELGWPIGTVSGRLSRAKAILGRKLSRSGTAVSAGTLTTRLVEARGAASTSMIAGLIGHTGRAACYFAPGRTAEAGVVSAEVMTLTNEVLSMLIGIKTRSVAAVLILGLALTAGGTCLAYRAEVVADPVAVAVAPQPPQEKTKEPAVDPMTSYPFKVDPQDVYEFADLTIDRGDFHLKTGPVSIVPISTERGITGAMVIGNGTFRYQPVKEKVIEGQSHAIMLRFSPGEQPAIVPFDKARRVTDRGIAEMSRHLLRVVIQHCYQSNFDGGRRQEVLIPPKGAFAAALYTKEYGDLLISTSEKTTMVFNFTDRKVLYEKK